MGKYGTLSVAAFAVAASALAGGFFGHRAFATDRRASDYRAYTAALGAVEANYIDKVDSARLVHHSTPMSSAR